MGSHGEHGEVGRCQRIREQPSTDSRPAPAPHAHVRVGTPPQIQRARQYPENPLLAYG